MSNGYQYTGASNHRLFADWMTWINEPQNVWTMEAPTLRARALDLVCNDAFSAALLSAYVQGTHGPRGLRLDSQADLHPDKRGTSDDSRALRRRITAATNASWTPRRWDASGLMSRRKFQAMLTWMSGVFGEGFAIRVTIKGRSQWRLVNPDRVENPDGRPNGDRLRDGFAFDAAGKVVGIYVRNATVGDFGVSLNPTWTYVPWESLDGTPNVIHRTWFVPPGGHRGITMFAPMLFLIRQQQGVMEAHVAGKRAQACNPLIYLTNDEAELTAALQAKARLGVNAVLGPMSILVGKFGSTDVKFMNTTFQGGDLRDFLVTLWRVQCAATGIPVEVALRQMGEATFSSARASLDDYDRTCQGFQEDDIEQSSGVVDEVIVRDSVVYDNMDLGGLTIDGAMVGRRSRPPKFSTDRLKDANTIKALREGGVSGTTAFDMFGLSWEDEQERIAEEGEFLSAQGLGDEEPTDPADDAGPTDPNDPNAPPAARAWAALGAWFRVHFKVKPRTAATKPKHRSNAA